MTGKTKVAITSLLLALTQGLGGLYGSSYVLAQGPVPIPPPVHTHLVPKAHVTVSANMKRTHHGYPGSVKIRSGRSGRKGSRKPAVPPPPPQNYVHDLSVSTVAPGVLHKVHRGAMYINVLDVDLTKSNLRVQPILAGESFNTLDEVLDQAQKVHAIAAVNGNYFKRDGAPLGTLIINGEWIAGPLFDRTCMGITSDGRVLVDRVNLHGTLTTSNPEAPSIWVNNINQPRRHGAHLIAYTRRWGNVVKMQYEGALVAVNAAGQVCAKDGCSLAVPAGGYVLSDCKEGQIAKLNIGDHAQLSWQTNPADWADVVDAVSGGPVLIRNGQLYIDLKDEHFTKAWTGSQIHARTAVGVTANRHLLLATIEGPHTLYDVAKFLKKLGAVDAMNLDGGGSTTMVIGDHAVTRNSSKFERRVASALAIVPRQHPHQPMSEVVQYQGSLRVSGQEIVPAIIMQSTSTNIDSESLQPSQAERNAAVNSVRMLPPAPAITQSPARSLPSTALKHSIAESKNVTAEPVAQAQDGKSGHFGWMKHLNPLK
jgi:uncharacterized protein YigE (DUF2233 family)